MITMMSVETPAKVILFGEHAVVYGEPAIAMAIDLTMRMTAVRAKKYTVDGYTMTDKHHIFIKRSIEKFWNRGPLQIYTETNVPSSSGMGSSAVVTICTIGIINAFQGTFEKEKIAREGFEIEYDVMGMASPCDTSVCTHGNGIMISKRKEKNHLWSIEKNDKTWHIHHVDVPDLPFVVGYTGIKGSTKKMISKVARYVKKSRFAMDEIREIGEIVLMAKDSLHENDLEKLGKLMIRNNQILVNLGVSHPLLDKLVSAVSRSCYGAKISGAGGGGCMIALCKNVEKVVERIEKAGGIPFSVNVHREGIRRVF